MEIGKDKRPNQKGDGLDDFENTCYDCMKPKCAFAGQDAGKPCAKHTTGQQSPQKAAGEESNSTPLLWLKVADKLPEEGQRVLTFSPCFPEGDNMRLRMMDGQFVEMCIDVTMWALPIEP